MNLSSPCGFYEGDFVFVSVELRGHAHTHVSIQLLIRIVRQIFEQTISCSYTNGQMICVCSYTLQV